jgi:KaiC/GvpD/RAD55 family RecA-like ATPase
MEKVTFGFYHALGVTFDADEQAIKKAFQDSLKEIDRDPENEGTWEKVYGNMREAMVTHQNFEVGTDYFNTIRQRYVEKELADVGKDRFYTGLTENIDNKITGGGYTRGEIISVVAGSGVGKSVMLACVTGVNLLMGKKGVYISCELAEAKIADRLDAIITGFPVQKLREYKDEIYENLTTNSKIWRPDQPNQLGALVIKEFPSGMASVNTIQAYLSQLRFRGYDPDFVIVDYIGEMADIPDMPLHQSREKTVRQLRAMAFEEKVFVAVAMQPNRDHKKETRHGERNRIDDDHLADSYGQIRPLDGCFSLNQNDTEKKLGIGRCYVIKQRDGESRYQFHLKFDKESLRITELSPDTYKRMMNTYQESAEEGVAVDKVKGAFRPNTEIIEPIESQMVWGEVENEPVDPPDAE